MRGGVRWLGVTLVALWLSACGGAEPGGGPAPEVPAESPQLDGGTPGGSAPDAGPDGGARPDGGTAPDGGAPDSGSGGGTAPDGGAPDGGPAPDGGGGAGGGGQDGGTPTDGGTPGAVLAVRHYGDAGDDRTASLARHAGTGDLLVALRSSGQGELNGEPLGEAPVHLALVRLHADGTRVWQRAFRVVEDASSVEPRSAYSAGAAFAQDGSLWVLIGWRYGSMDLGTGLLPTGDYLVKLAADGATQRIQPLWSPTGLALPYGLAADAQGGVLVTGQFERTVDFGGGPVTSTRRPDGIESYTGFLASYGADGTLRWVRTFGGREDYGAGVDVATHASGDILVGGTAHGEAQFAGTPLPSAAAPGEVRGVLARLSAQGDVRWVKAVGNHVRQVALSPLGTAVAAGTVDYDKPLSWAGQTLSGNARTFLVTAEVDGTERWARRYVADSITGLGVDDAGSARLLVRGMRSTDFGGGPSGGSGLAPTFAVRVNLDGAWRWTRELPPWIDDGLDLTDAPRLALAADGSAWVLGSFNGTFSAGGVSLRSRGSNDVYLLQLAP